MRPSIPLYVPIVCAALAGCANDKNLHFVAGAATSKYVAQHTDNPMAGCVAALTAGITKEALDARFGGDVGAHDALATLAGCAVTLRF